jgi:hypothetical protein
MEVHGVLMLAATLAACQVMIVLALVDFGRAIMRPRGRMMA